MSDPSLLDVAGVSTWAEPARTRSRTATVANAYLEGAPTVRGVEVTRCPLAAHVSVVEAWDSPPGWFDVPSLDLQPSLLRIILEAFEAGMGRAAGAGPRPSVEALARAAFEAAQAALADRFAAEKSVYAGSGAMAASAVATQRNVTVAWMGRARVYLVQEGVTLLTRDHTVVEDYRRASPGVTQEELDALPHQGIFTRALGMAGVEVETVTRPLHPGDRLVLVSPHVHEILDVPAALVQLDPRASAHAIATQLATRACALAQGVPLAVAVLRRQGTS